MQAKGINASYGAYGGAVHVQNENADNKGKLILSGGTLIGNTCTGNGTTEGAGIYLAVNNNGIATMELYGAPTFGTDVNGSTAATTDDANTVTMSGYSSKQNGQESVYTDNKVRQDIMIAENSGAAPQSIVITDDLVSSGGTYIGDGSIWVWAEKDAHSKQLMPFAKLGTGVEFYTKQSDSDTIPADKFDAAHLKAFRNAQDDNATENTTDTYLYGTLEGDTAGYVYWTGIGGFRKVILRSERLF